MMLAEMAVTKDKSLYVQLYQHFAPKVKAYIIRLGMMEATAEELTQEAMLNMWRKSHLFQPGKSAASTWLFTLARNQSIDWMRKQKYPEYSWDDIQESSDDVSGVDTQENKQFSLNGLPWQLVSCLKIRPRSCICRFMKAVLIQKLQRGSRFLWVVLSHVFA